MLNLDLKKKLLLIELSCSHTEIIEPIVSALTYNNSNIDIDLVIPQLGFERIAKPINIHNYFSVLEDSAVSEILKILKNKKYDLILLNSSQGKKARNLCLRLFFDTTPIVGFHHNPQALIKSSTQKIINLKIKKYILLAQFNYDYLIRNGFKKEQLSVFYALPKTHCEFQAFLNYLKLNNQMEVQNKKIIAIPGVLEQDRRDYFGLIEIIKDNPESFKNVVFALIGNSSSHDGPMIVKKIKNYNLDSYFFLFESYVEVDIMNSILKMSSMIMTLIHPENRFFSEYLNSKISGAYNLAYAFKKPLLLHENFQIHQEFEKNCIFYNFNNLNQQINQTVIEDTEFYKKFDSESQSKNLISFLNLE